METDIGAMTEPDWFSCSSPEGMLKFLQDQGFGSDRKMRLFAVACCEHVQSLLTDTRSLHAIEVAGRYADGDATEEDLERARRDAWAAIPRVSGMSYAARRVARSSSKAAMEVVGQAIRKLVASISSSALEATCAAAGMEGAKIGQYATFQEVKFRDESAYQSGLLRDIFCPFIVAAFDPAWRTETVQLLSRAMYESRDFSAMVLLSDALIDAGCNEPAVLDHCRGDGPHVRGCFVVDWCWGKE